MTDNGKNIAVPVTAAARPLTDVPADKVLICDKAMDFTGKVVIMTGASSGIGAVTTKMFAAHGATLSLIGRDETRLLDVARACERARGIKPLLILLDLTKNHSCDIIAQKTVEVFGRIDVVVHCAGKLALTSLYDTNMDVYDDLFAINVRVPYELTQKCLPHLIKTKGHIINVYGGSNREIPGFIALAMISEALERFTKSSAMELAAKGVTMNSVRLGLTRTNIDDEDTHEALAQMVPSREIIEPDEVAKMVVLVASSMFPLC